MIAAAVRGFAAKLRQTTPRERAGLAALVAIGALTAAVYGMEWASTSAAAASFATQTASESEAMLSAFQSETYRQRLSTQAGNAWRWSQASDAFAGETVLAELDSMGQQAGLNEARVALVEQATASGQVGSIEASINADFEWASFLAFLEALENAELSFAFRSIDVTEVEGAQRIALTISVPTISTEEPR